MTGLTLLAALVLASPAHAAGETAAFLKVGVDARMTALGGGASALADGILSSAINPAGLSRLGRQQAAFSHTELPLGSRLEFAGYARPISIGTIGAGITHLTEGSIDGRDASGKPTGSFNADDSAFALNYALRLPSRLRLGGSFKYVQSRIGAVSGDAFAADLGGQVSLGAIGPGAIEVGASITNLGSPMRLAGTAEPLPMAVGLGGAYRLASGLALAADVRVRPHSGERELDMGTEYALVAGFAVRAGYAGMRRDSTAGTMDGISAGLGIKVASYHLDYAITPFAELGNVHRIALSTSF